MLKTVQALSSLPIKWDEDHTNVFTRDGENKELPGLLEVVFCHLLESDFGQMLKLRDGFSVHYNILCFPEFKPGECIALVKEYVRASTKRSEQCSSYMLVYVNKELQKFNVLQIIRSLMAGKLNKDFTVTEMDFFDILEPNMKFIESNISGRIPLEKSKGWETLKELAEKTNNDLLRKVKKPKEDDDAYGFGIIDTEVQRDVDKDQQVGQQVDTIDSQPSSGVIDLYQHPTIEGNDIIGDRICEMYQNLIDAISKLDEKLSRLTPVKSELTDIGNDEDDEEESLPKLSNWEEEVDLAIKDADYISKFVLKHGVPFKTQRIIKEEVHVKVDHLNSSLANLVKTIHNKMKLSHIEFKFKTNVALTVNVEEKSPNRLSFVVSSLKNKNGKSFFDWHYINIFIDHIDEECSISAEIINGETLKPKKLKKFLAKFIDLLFTSFDCEKGEFKFNEN